MATNFEELNIWKKAHQLTLEVYKLSSQWPKTEIYGLISQTRRAALSVELLIAEGHARYHYSDMVRFMHAARASAQEVRSCFMVARDLEEIAISEEIFDYFNKEYIGLIKGINGFIIHLKNKKSGKIISKSDPIN